MEKTLLKILVLEDNTFFAGLLSESLKGKYQAQVSVCENISAFFKVFDDSFDVIILDYFLDNQEKDTGKDVLHKIREQNVDTPVIFLSSMDDINSTVDVFHDGATDFIKKDDMFFAKLSFTIDKILKINELQSEMEEISEKSKKFKKRVAISFSLGILVLSYLLFFY